MENTKEKEQKIIEKLNNLKNMKLNVRFIVENILYRNQYGLKKEGRLEYYFIRNQKKYLKDVLKYVYQKDKNGCIIENLEKDLPISKHTIYRIIDLLYPIFIDVKTVLLEKGRIFRAFRITENGKILHECLELCDEDMIKKHKEDKVEKKENVNKQKLL